MSRSTSLLILADLAAGQWGLFTTAQARSVGVSPQQLARLAERGAVDRLRHGVYRIAGAPMAPEELLRAAWLMIEPAATVDERLRQDQPAVVSFRSAALLHGLGDADADVMEFTVARRKQSRLTDVRYRVAVLSRGQWTLVDGLPVTTVRATIEDLAADHLDGGHLAGIVRDAVISGGVDPDDAVAALRPYAHSYGAALGDGSGLLDRFLAEAGVPEPARKLSQRLPVNRAAAIAAAHDAVAEAARRSTSLTAGSPLRRALADLMELESRGDPSRPVESARAVTSTNALRDVAEELRSTGESGFIGRILAELDAPSGRGVCG